MAKPSRNLRQKLLRFAYVLAAALFIVLLPARVTAPARIMFTQAVGPAEQVAFNAAGQAAAATGTLRDAFLGQERSRALEREVQRLRNQSVVLKEVLLDRESRISSFEQLKVEGFAFSALSAPVTAYDSSTMRHSITVAVGSRHGVREGLAVCALGALVGEVSEAGPWYSRVRLITDPASCLACRVQRTRRLCVVQGTGGVNCTVEWLDRDADVRPGDVLITAPTDEALSQRPLVPPGLPVATVVLADRERADPMFKHVSAAPRVNVRRLEVVEIVIPR